MNRIVGADALLDTAFAIAERVAANGPFAAKAAKCAIQDGLDNSLQGGLALEGSL